MEIFINSRYLTQKVTGVQRYAIEISKQLKKLRPEIEFVAPKNIIHKGLAEDLNVKIIGKHTGHLWEQYDLPKYLKKEEGPLLLNSANTAPLFYKKQIITIFDLSFLRNPRWFSKKFYVYYKLLIPKLIKKSMRIITISEFSKKEIVDLLNTPENKIRVIHCGVSEDIITLSGTELHNRYGQYVLAVSSLDPRKNFKNLIHAFNKLNLKDTKLIIAGSRSEVFANHELKNLIKENSNVLLTGYLSDNELSGLYKNATLFVYPSLYEGFGLPPLEAMACGCPVVVSNAASLPEVCGDAAYYVDPYDIDDIAKGIYEVLTDDKLQQELRQKGLERVKLFNWKESAEKLLSVIKEVLDE